MKQINVPVEDEVYNAAKVGAATAGILMKDWVARAIMHFGGPPVGSANSPQAPTSARAVETDAPGHAPAQAAVRRKCARCGRINEKWFGECESCGCGHHVDAPGELTIDPNQDFGA